jgi:hypothetical protein
MKKSISILLVLFMFRMLTNTDAFAVGSDPVYPDSLNMTCAQAKDYINKNDGAILATGSAYASFHSSYCSGQPAYVRTKDVRYCFVGLYCGCETTYCAQSYIE